MKAATSALQTMLQRGYDIKALPKVRAEWEHNRYSKINAVSVTPAQVEDTDWKSVFSLDSITLPNRPRNGVAKVRMGTTKVKLAKKYRDLPTSSRFYLATLSDSYKYFASTQKSGLSAGGDGGYAFTTPIALSVVYEEDVIANKIVVGFETSYSKPKSFNLQITTDGTTWTSVAAPNIDTKGQATIWVDEFDQWSTLASYDNFMIIRGVRVIVSSMVDANSHLDVIQLGARLENDLTDFVEEYSKEMDISDRSFIAPLGKSSSNTANITLSNIDRRFNNTNEDSIYFGLIGKKTKITLDLSFDASEFAGSTDERIREFVMWTDSWGGQEETSVTITLKDSSVFLQETPCPKVFWEGLTVGAIIWQLMDILGFTNYEYTRDLLDAGQTVPYFWPDPNNMAWEQISALAEGTQTAVYFDENDVLQIRPRNYAFKADRPIDWNLDAIQNGQKLPDIVKIEVNEELAANNVDIKYQPAKFSDFNNGFPKMETVWEPEDGALVLRASSLVKDLLIGHTSMWINYQEAAIWPFEAKVNIRGEVLSYKGKEYTWNKPDGTKAQVILYSQEDKDRVDSESNQNLAWANVYTGKLIIDKRNLGETGLVDHKTSTSVYTTLVTNYENTSFYSLGGRGISIANGRMTVGGQNIGEHHYLLAMHEAVVNGSDTTYGGRISFPENQPLGRWTCGGFHFAGGAGDEGLWLEISTTEVIEAENRGYRNEITLVGMPIGGRAFYFPHQDPKILFGHKANISKGVTYAVDIRHKVNVNGTANVSVFLDGVIAAEWTLSAAQRTNLGAGNRFGAFVRGYCNMEVDSIYAVYQQDAALPDRSTFLDLVSGSFTSGYIERQWRYGETWRSMTWAPIVNTSTRANYALDEFGPVVHEIREFEVVYDDDSVPVAHSFLYVSNPQVAIINYWANAFGAKFVLANASRVNVIVSGEDKLTFGEENPVNQKAFVYGRVLYQEDDMTVTKRDEDSIRRNGTISLEFDSRFIQTDQAANSLGDWVVNQWDAVSEEMEVEVFGSPLYQIGDKVSANYPIKDMYPSTHRYYIVGINNKFSGGLESSIVLRRAKN